MIYSYSVRWKERGYWNANVIVETDDPDFPPFEISAYGQVKDADGVVEFGFVVPTGGRLDGLSFDLFKAFNASKDK